MLPTIRHRAIIPNWADDFFGKDFIANFFEPQTGINTPAVNIVETKNEYRIEVAAPGLDKNDFKIELENNMLRISSTKEDTHNETTDRYLRREFSYTAFSRAFSLPLTVESDKISATHLNGILHITIPKRDEAKEKPMRNINIE